MLPSPWLRQAFVAVVFSFLIRTGQVYADAGDLDRAFGTDGKVTTDLSGREDEARAVAIQSDGKIVAVGLSEGSNVDFAVARYNVDGSLDITFGNAGKVITDFVGYADVASSVVIQRDGKIVVAGYAGNGSNSDFALARYNLDGSLDTAFGIGGRVTTDFGREDRASIFLIQTDGNIVTAGTTGEASGRDFALARYTQDGTLDITFGVGGKVTTDFFGETDRALALAIQTDGKIVMAGGAGTYPRSDFALARYEAGGTLDVTFGNGGKVTTELGGDETIHGLSIQSDGKIIAHGFVTTGFGSDFGIARYNPDGTVDTAFGTRGKVVTSFGFHNYGSTLAVQADGRIVVAGFNDMGPIYGFVLARYTSDGAQDSTFGTSGIVSSPFSGGDNWPNAVAMQADGKIVVVGYAEGSLEGDFAIVRYDSGVPAVSEVRFEPAYVQAGSGFTATFSGINLSEQTYFDIRFRAPQSTTDEVILNWQQGLSALRVIGIGTATGTWTLTGVRAHEHRDEHIGEFVSVPAALVVAASRTAN